jgi:hypothetical protein
MKRGVELADRLLLEGQGVIMKRGVGVTVPWSVGEEDG